METTIRAIAPEEIPAMRENMGYGFGFDPMADEEEHFAALLELERTCCAFEGPTLVGTCGAYSLDLVVPGGALATGGTTLVTVRGTHRRRGLLRGMMRAHLEDVQARGEPLAALWASESSIYGRFGYGVAAWSSEVQIDRVRGAFACPPAASGRTRLVRGAEALKLLPQVYDAVYRERPGHFARSAAWWEHRRTYDPEWERGGASAYRYALYEEGGVPRGYLQYRIKHGAPGADAPATALRVVELQAGDPTALAALWRYALDVDLVDRIEAWNRPLDDVLPWLLDDPRRLRQLKRDALYVRPVDVAAALEGRVYSAEGRVVLGLRDPFLPQNEGAYALEAGSDGARCRRTSEEPELELDVADLGALYLGGNRFLTLARAGRVAGEPAALRRADAMFRWDPLPWCPEVF